MKTIKKERAKSAYSFFAAQFRTTLTSEQKSGKSLGDVSKMCATAWAALENKGEYEELAASDRARLQAAAPPKKPPSAFIRFSSAERAKLKESEPGLAFADVSKRCAVAWNALTADEKAAWKATPEA